MLTPSYYDPETSEDAYIMFQDQEVSESQRTEHVMFDRLCKYKLKEIIKSIRKVIGCNEAQLMFKMGNAEKARCGVFDLIGND